MQRARATEIAADMHGRAIAAFALGQVVAFELTEGSPDARIGPFDDTVILQVVSLAAIRMAQAVVAEEDEDDYAAASIDTLLPPNHVQLIHLIAGEMFGVLREADDATGTITVLR